MRWFYAAVPILLLLTLIVWRLEVNHATAIQQAQMMKRRVSAPASVELGTVQFRDLVTSFEATGSVESPQNVKIAPRVTGIILTPNAHDAKYRSLYEGDFVREGQIMARIDPSEYKANLDQAKAALAQARFHLVQAQLTQNPTDVQVKTQINTQVEGVNSALANNEQAKRNSIAQTAAAQAAVNDATSKVVSAVVAVDNAKQGIASAEASYNSAQQGVENAKTAIASAEANRDSAKTAILNTEEAIKSAVANQVDAKAKYERTKKLYEQGYETGQDVDDAQAALDVQNAAVEVAKGQKTQATSALAAQEAAVATAQGQWKMAISALDVQQAAVATAKGQLNAAQAALTSAQEEENSSKEQYHIAVTSGEASIKDTNAALRQAKESLKYANSNTAQIGAYVQNIAALKAAVAAAQAQQDLAKTQLAETVLTAPFDGYVTTLYMDPGSMASPNQPIFALQSINAVWVTIAVPEYVFTKVQDGQSASVHFDAFPQQTFTARIVQLNPAADPQGRQFTLRAVLNNTDKKLKPGMFARVSVETERIPHALVVPREAVNQNADGSSFVYTVMANNAQTCAHIQPVTTGASDVAYIQVDGVQPGEKVVTMSATALQEGKAITTGGGRKGKRGGAGNQPGAPSGAPGQAAPSMPTGTPAPSAGANPQGDGTASPMPNAPNSGAASPMPNAPANGTASPQQQAPGSTHHHHQSGAQSSGG